MPLAYKPNEKVLGELRRLRRKKLDATTQVAWGAVMHRTNVKLDELWALMTPLQRLLATERSPNHLDRSPTA